jgi:signal transduction histidine kinase
VTTTRTLRFRFAWRAAVITMLITAAVGAVSTVYLTQQVRGAIHDGVVDHLDTLEVELNLTGLSAEEGSAPLVLPSPERFVQVITPEGRVVAASSELGTRAPLLTRADIDAAARGDVEATISNPGGEGEAFVMARPVTAGDTEYIGLVGSSLARVDGARRTMLLWMGLAVPLLGLVIWLGVWAAVTFALRPVNALASEADRLASSRGPWQLGVEPDTVELNRLAKSLDALLAQVRQAFERERKFLDDASHELRTPIAVARGELELALGEGPRAEMEKAVESSIEELDRLDRLASDLLLLGRARSRDRRTFGDIDLGGVTRRAAALVMRHPSAPPVGLSVAGEATTFGDEQAIERAITNVITNAVTWCSSRVEVVLADEADRATIRVRDDGPGFPDELLAGPFGRFNRTEDERSREGSGLGLAIATEIVTTHQGTIEAANVPEGGAVVTIRLPRREG